MDDFRFTASLLPLSLPSSIDGVLGIGPAGNRVIGDPLVQLLEDTRVIGYSAVSLFLGNPQKQMRLGHMNPDLINSDDSLHWIAQDVEFANVSRLFIGRRQVPIKPLTIKLNPSTPFIVLPDYAYSEAVS